VAFLQDKNHISCSVGSCLTCAYACLRPKDRQAPDEDEDRCSVASDFMSDEKTSQTSCDATLILSCQGYHHRCLSFVASGLVPDGKDVAHRVRRYVDSVAPGISSPMFVIRSVGACPRRKGRRTQGATLHSLRTSQTRCDATD